MTVRRSVHHDVSPALRDMPVIPPDNREPHLAEPRRQRPIPKNATIPTGPDAVLQTAPPLVPPQELAPLVNLNFEGLGIGTPGYKVNVAPSDTNGAVGLTQYVQWVNTNFAVYDKSTQAITFGPAAGQTLWANFNMSDPKDACRLQNDGDPIVTYDKLANRWVFSQFAFNLDASNNRIAPFMECIAVSTTTDATGTYNRYEFQYADFDDYPKMGVWSDGYYETFNFFDPNTGFFVAFEACAYDRTAMLAGNPAIQICFQNPNYFGVLPADVDGSTPPPAGSPEYFGTWDTNVFDIFKFHVDFATPANSTFTNVPVQVPVASFTALCGGAQDCVPQPGTTQMLDSLGDATMYRLAYRNFGDHESLVVNHSVAANCNGNCSGGIRWYEIQDPGSATPFLAQQSTWAPDNDFRWMGSIAMDHIGDIAMGYSVSSATTHPSIAITGRLHTDAPNTLQAETTIVSGTGSQIGNTKFPDLNRWGDYSAIQVDPVDDCTFWFTTEYMSTTGSFNWNTRIATFKFPSCGAPPPPPLRFVATSPCRVIDTRIIGPFIAGNGTRDVTVGGSSSPCGIPSTAQAYSLNVTVVPHGPLGFLTMFPCGQSKPFVSNLNSGDGRVKAVAAIVPAGTNNDVCAFATNDTDLVLDINGYFVPATDPNGLAFYPVTPCRLVDTRNPSGPLGGPILSANTSRTFPVLTASCPDAIPNTAVAYSLNYTVVPQGALGFLTTWPTGLPKPLVSTLNAPTGAVLANAAIVPAGNNGSVDVFVTNDTHVVIDINGYFAPAATGGLSFYAVTPCRALDSRNPPGAKPFSGQRDSNLGATTCMPGATPQAFVLNATVVPSSGSLGFLTLWPQGTTRPLVSTLNASDGAVTSNLAIVPTNNGSISSFATNPTQLVLDLSGYFAP